MDESYASEIMQEGENLEQKESELNELLNTMDQLQEEVDELQQKISSITYEINKAENENYRSSKIKNAVDFEPFHSSKASNIPDSMFSGEHLEYIKEKRNLLANLGEQINQIKIEMAPDEEYLQQLQQQNAFLLCEKSNTRKRLQKVSAEQKNINEELSLIQTQIKETDVNIANNERIMKDTELIVSGLIRRLDLVKNQTDANGAYTQQITSLEKQIAIIQDENSQLKDDLAQTEKLYEEDQRNLKSRLDFAESKLNWTKEQKNLTEELKQIQQKLSEIKKQRDECFNSNNEIEGRFNKLLPLINKWLPLFRGKPISEETEVHIDTLLQQYHKKKNGTKQAMKKDTESHESLVFENEKLEGKIARKQEELSRIMTRFATEQNKFKAMIQANRSNCFEDEHKILEQINKLKIKIAKRS